MYKHQLKERRKLSYKIHHGKISKTKKKLYFSRDGLNSEKDETPAIAINLSKMINLINLIYLQQNVIMLR